MTAPKVAQEKKLKAPQDHLQKAKPFTFTHEGVKYTLPPPSEALGKIPGRLLRDAVMNGGEAEIRLGFTCLEAVDPDPAALDALYAKPVAEMSKVVGRWMQSPATDGATLPES